MRSFCGSQISVQRMMREREKKTQFAQQLFQISFGRHQLEIGNFERGIVINICEKYTKNRNHDMILRLDQGCLNDLIPLNNCVRGAVNMWTEPGPMFISDILK